MRRSRACQMLTMMSWMILCVLLAGCVSGWFGPRVSASSQHLYREVPDYYPLGLTKRIEGTFPNHLFDTDVTIEGIGWENGEVFLVLHAVVRVAENVYFHAPKRFYPRITVDGKTAMFHQLLWEEGAPEHFDQSQYRYAVRAETNILPPGTLPDQLLIENTPFPLPAALPAARKLPAQPLLEARTGRIPKIVESSELRYLVEGVRIGAKERQIKLLVTSELGGEETSRFLLQDDKGRIYSFEPHSLPEQYRSGPNEIMLEISQPLPADIRHLRLVIFEADLQQQGLYTILDQAGIDLF